MSFVSSPTLTSAILYFIVESFVYEFTITLGVFISLVVFPTVILEMVLPFGYVFSTVIDSCGIEIDVSLSITTLAVPIVEPLLVNDKVCFGNVIFVISPESSYPAPVNVENEIGSPSIDKFIFLPSFGEIYPFLSGRYVPMILSYAS